ncbi:hypothetical protein ACRAWD_18890 [Caulobacter segnis]
MGPRSALLRLAPGHAAAEQSGGRHVVDRLQVLWAGRLSGRRPGLERRPGRPRRVRPAAQGPAVGDRLAPIRRRPARRDRRHRRRGQSG